MRQKSRNAELHALISLKDSVVLKAMGCRFDRGLTGGVCMTLAGCGIGAWWYENGVYNFASKAYRKPVHSARSTDEVIAITRTLATNYFIQNQNLAV